MHDGEQDTIVYQITDYSISLEYAQEMMKQGYHVTTLVFTKQTPTPPQETPLLGVI